MKKNEKRLCWNCDGDVSLHLNDCPFCGVSLSQPEEKKQPYNGLGDPFQKAPAAPYQQENNLSVSKEEWEHALNEEEEQTPKTSARHEVIALLLLLPGIVFCLFGLLLLLFSDDGTLTLHWNQNLAYFYFLGAVPLIYLGWRAVGK
ncbi:MAG: hypothetical protein S4CHLAM45_11480 [Chlamydiales bacterium]|nr:hypothetical protein [Chlamydiales bacterium]MCH9619640.1 hypothetical protein [Chlamydiales bacterium]MCH9623246.1 hypothetical protein [Chlamydiales bacterium]